MVWQISDIVTILTRSRASHNFRYLLYMHSLCKEKITHRKPHAAEDELCLGAPVAAVVLVVVVRSGHGGGSVVATVRHGSDAVAALRH